MKIQTIFDSKSRPDTTGIYVDYALENLGHKVIHVNPSVDSLCDDVDLTIMVDDGFDYEFSRDIPNLAFWAIDTHITPDICIKKAKKAKWIFTAQKNGKKLFPDSTWLPLAVNHSPFGKTSELKYDICFVGNVHPKIHERRLDYLDALFKAFPNFHFSQDYNMERVNQKYASSKIVFNCSVNEDINMRVFEAMAVPAFVLTDHIDEMEDLGIIKGKHCETYKGLKELLEKSEYYLKHDEERMNIALAGSKEVRSNHTYVNRVKKILEACK